MYFWKIEKLKDQIKSGKLSEKDKFIYMFIYLVSIGIFGELFLYIIPIIENPNIWDIVYSASSILIMVFGTIYAFKVNGGSSGVDFLGKYFSISFVLGIRFLVLSVPLYIGLFFYYKYTFNEEDVIPSTMYDTIPFVIWLVLLYWRICKHISDISSVDR